MENLFLASLHEEFVDLSSEVFLNLLHLFVFILEGAVVVFFFDEV